MQLPHCLSGALYCACTANRRQACSKNENSPRFASHDKTREHAPLPFPDLSCPGSSVNKNPCELRPQAMSTARRRWGSGFTTDAEIWSARRMAQRITLLLLLSCVVSAGPARRERGGGTAPLISNTTTEFVSRESIVDSSNSVLTPPLPDPPHRSSSPSPLVVARPRSGAAQSRSASSHGVGREFTGAVGGWVLVWG